MTEHPTESKCPYCNKMMPYGGCRDFDAANACPQSPENEIPEESKPERPD